MLDLVALGYALMAALFVGAIVWHILERRADRRRAERRANRGYTCLLFIPRDGEKGGRCQMCGELEPDHVDFDEWQKARAKRPITDDERDELETGMWPR